RMINVISFFFFFQAEDGIRDKLVTGVQTCALPIWPARDLARPADHARAARADGREGDLSRQHRHAVHQLPRIGAGAEARGGSARSEERRVGKECGRRWVRCSYINIRMINILIYCWT